jgi:hypothetical protein
MATRSSSSLLVLALAGVASPGTVSEPRPLLYEHEFSLDATAEVVAAIAASCRGCDWGRVGHEAAVLRLRLDGRYSQHVVLARGEGAAEYRVSLGTLGPGAHRLALELDVRLSAAGSRTAHVSGVETEASPRGSASHELLEHAPILHVRPGALGRFSDVPLVMWAETDATARGTRVRYSVVFSNEDGGTPPDRLMATWGRLTDIEYAYGVEIDASGRILAEEFQGRDHLIQPFAGAREGTHPVLHVVTDNNMFAERGGAPERVAPAPVPADLTGVSREAVMDAHPWTYVVSAREARREGRVESGAVPGDGKIPDPRRFAYLEACAESRDTALTFGVGIDGGDGVSFHDSDGGQPTFRIARSPDHFPNGCFRGAVALPEGAGRIRALRFSAFSLRSKRAETPPGSASAAARVWRVNKLFLLGDDDYPGPSLFQWEGSLALTPDAQARELEIDG